MTRSTFEYEKFVENLFADRWNKFLTNTYKIFSICTQENERIVHSQEK